MPPNFAVTVVPGSLESYLIVEVTTRRVCSVFLTWIYEAFITWKEYGGIRVWTVIFQRKASRTYEAAKRPAYQESENQIYL